MLTQKKYLRDNYYCSSYVNTKKYLCDNYYCSGYVNTKKYLRDNYYCSSYVNTKKYQMFKSPLYKSSLYLNMYLYARYQSL